MSTEGDKRKQERIKRRTTRLDGFFAFSAPQRPDAGGQPIYTRGEAEQRASTLLAPLPALPGIVMEASKPAGPSTSGLQGAIDSGSPDARLAIVIGNADFFRRGRPPVSSLSELIDGVGTAGFRNITLMAFFRRIFSAPLPWYGYEPFGLWRHLVGTAIAAWRISDHTGAHRIASEQAFFAALLHDVGKPTIQGLMADKAPPAKAASMDGQLTVLETERRIVNMVHSELVPLILDIWGIEHDVFLVAEHHHAPQRAGEKAHQAGVLQLADTVANVAGIGIEGEYGFLASPLEKAAAKLGLEEAFCADLAGELGWLVSEIAAQAQALE